MKYSELIHCGHCQVPGIPFTTGKQIEIQKLALPAQSVSLGKLPQPREAVRLWTSGQSMAVAACMLYMVEQTLSNWVVGSRSEGPPWCWLRLEAASRSEQAEANPDAPQLQLWIRRGTCGGSCTITLYLLGQGHATYILTSDTQSNQIRSL